MSYHETQACKDQQCHRYILFCVVLLTQRSLTWAVPSSQKCVMTQSSWPWLGSRAPEWNLGCAWNIMPVFLLLFLTCLDQADLLCRWHHECASDHKKFSFVIFAASTSVLLPWVSGYFGVKHTYTHSLVAVKRWPALDGMIYRYWVSALSAM